MKNQREQGGSNLNIKLPLPNPPTPKYLKKSRKENKLYKTKKRLVCREQGDFLSLHFCSICFLFGRDRQRYSL